MLSIALERPIFVVGTPQAGTTYVFSALGTLPAVVPLSANVRDVFDQAAELRPAVRGHDSNRRTADDVTPETAERIRTSLLELLPDRAENPRSERVIDGAPRHALRIPFLDAVFPDAMFVYVYRSPRETIAGMIEAWDSGLYITYPNLPDWPGSRWSMLLIPGWRRLAGKRVAEIATVQWTTTTRIMLDDLSALAPERWAVVDYAALLEDPGEQLERLAGVLGLEWQAKAAAASPAAFVLRPSESRSRQLEAELQRLLPQTIGLAEAAHDLLAAPVSRRPTATPDFDAATRSVHSAGFARLLDRLECSLLLSTGTTGKLVCVRHDGARVNTHFHDLPQTRALAAAETEFAVVAGDTLHRYRDERPAGAGVPPSRHDAWFVPKERVSALADAIAFGGGDLWVASGEALGRLGEEARERWRLPFAIDDRAPRWRITGIAMNAGEPAYVSAQPRTVERRPGEPAGGCVVECASGRVLADGLGEPRAPLLHEGRLWLIERDRGRLCAIDPDTGERGMVVELPGSARALAVSGSTAFVALSRIRKAGSGRPAGAYSGISVVDLGRGQAGAYLRFEGDLAEVYDVALLPFRYPEISDRY